MKIALVLAICLVCVLSACTVCEKPLLKVEGACCMDADSDGACDKEYFETPEPVINTTEEPIIQELQEPKITEQKITLPDKKIQMTELAMFLNNLTNRGNTLRKDNTSTPFLEEMAKKQHSFYTNNNQVKWWTVEVFDKKSLESMDDFYDYVSAKDWQGFRYYVNETNWRYLDPEISEAELKEIDPAYSYKTYYKTDVYSNWVDLDVVEDVMQSSKGPILRYRLETMILTPEEDGYWLGNWEPTILIYKIPCTKDMIIYYRPPFGEDFGSTGHRNQRKSVANQNWERDLIKNNPESMRVVEAIMDFCGVANTSSDKATVYEKHEQMVQNWKVYYGRTFNYSLDAKVATRAPADGRFMLDNINFTFIGADDEEDLWTLRAKLSIAGKYSERDLREVTLHVGDIKAGDARNVSVTFDDERIEKNSTLVIKPYFGNAEDPEMYKYYLKTIKIDLK